MIAAFQKQLRELHNQVRALSSIQIEGFNRSSGGSGLSFVRGLHDSPPAWRDKTVVIIRKPVEGDRTLLVREARYKTLPPAPCTGDGDAAACQYEWIGGSFEVYPPLGMKPVGFAGEEYLAGGDGQGGVPSADPKLTTKFHRIHREYDAWILSAPAAGGGENRIGIITAAAGLGQFVTFQEVQESETGFTAVGSSEQVKVWPGSVASDFTQHVTSAGVTDGPYVMLVMHRGTEYAMQTMVFYTFAPTGTVTAGDCA